MQTEEVVGLLCTTETFRPVGHEEARRLDQGEGLALFQQFSRETGAEPPSREEWEEWHQQGYRYCGLARGETITAEAAVWT